MEENIQRLEKKLKGLRLFYLILGVISIVYGFLGFWGIIFFSAINHLSALESIPTDMLIELLVLTVSHFLASFLFVITYYEFLKSIKFGRFTGVIGCLLLLVFPIYVWIVFSFTFNFFFVLYIADIALLLITLLYWKRIPHDRNFEIKSKTKKIIAIGIVGIIIVGILIVEAPQIQKNFVLGQLRYADYDSGFGFNPPEGWNASKKYSYVQCFPPTGINSSDKVSLSVGSYIWDPHGITMDEVKEKFLDDRSSLSNSTVKFSIISQNPRMVNGMNAYEFVYSYQEKIGNITGSNITEKSVFFIVKNMVSWTVRYKALENLFGTYEDVVEQSINSITII